MLDNYAIACTLFKHLSFMLVMKIAWMNFFSSSSLAYFKDTNFLFVLDEFLMRYWFRSNLWTRPRYQIQCALTAAAHRHHIMGEKKRPLMQNALFFAIKTIEAAPEGGCAVVHHIISCTLRVSLCQGSLNIWTEHSNYS